MNTNFFEQELKKIISPIYPAAHYVGRACYVNPGTELRVKIEFTGSQTVGHYNAIKVSMLAANCGVIDENIIKFIDVFGYRPPYDPRAQAEYKFGIIPFIKEYTDQYPNRADWPLYQPNDEDYAKLRRIIKNYIDVFGKRTYGIVNVRDNNGYLATFEIDGLDENFHKMFINAHYKWQRGDDEWMTTILSELQKAGYPAKPIQIFEINVDGG